MEGLLQQVRLALEFCRRMPLVLLAQVAQSAWLDNLYLPSAVQLNREAQAGVEQEESTQQPWLRLVRQEVDRTSSTLLVALLVQSTATAVMATTTQMLQTDFSR